MNSGEAKAVETRRMDMPLNPRDDSAPFFRYSDDEQLRIYTNATRRLLRESADSYRQDGWNRIFENNFGSVRTVTLKSPSDRYVHFTLDETCGLLRRMSTGEIFLGDTREKCPEICDPLIIPVCSGTGGPGFDEGMGYLIRLSDGRFLIVDGGYPQQIFAEKIFLLLKQYAATPNPVRIAAWILTHAHIDHVGAFLEFAKRYKDDPSVVIESFLLDFVEDPEFCRFFENSSARVVKNAILDCYPNAKIYRPLTGQTYPFGTMILRVLFTTQDYLPRIIPNEPDATEKNPKKGDGNHLSLVFRLETDNSSFLILSDTTKVCCDELCRRYGTLLKSDFVQMAHHGMGITDPTVYQPRRANATRELYRLINPTVAFLPCSKERAPIRLNYEANREIREKARRIIVGGEDVPAIPFAKPKF